VILDCYMDESVDGDNEIAYCVAGVIGTKAQWDWLEEQWREVLDDNGIKYFKNSECSGLTGEFLRFRTSPIMPTPEDRSKAFAIRQTLLALCVNSRITVNGVTVDLKAFKTVVTTPDKQDAFGGTPYYHCYCLAIQECALTIKEHRPEDSLAFGFDEHEEYGKILQRAYSELKHVRPDLSPHLATIAPFDDKQFIPIQVADLFAAMVRRYSVNDLQQLEVKLPTEMTAVKGKGTIHAIKLCRTEHLEAFLQARGLF
jgi:hypothetical protein